MQGKRFICRTPSLGLALLLVLGCTAAGAQSRTAAVRLVVPYPAGGAADQITRLVANDAAQALGAPIVIENKAGAAGMIAAEAVLRAEPDGATFFVGSNAPLVINQAIYDKIPYDPEKDFVPVAGMGKSPLLLVTRKDLGARDLPSLIAMGRKEPGKLSMGSASSGNITHLAGEFAVSHMGFKVTHVPFAGSAPAITSLMGGNVDMMFDALPSSLQQARAGRIVPLAVMDGQRFAQLPDVPTMKELGYEPLQASAWFGVVARAGTPQQAIDVMNAAINEALGKQALVDKLAHIGARPMPGTAAQFGQFIAAERRQWVPQARALGVKVD